MAINEAWSARQEASDDSRRFHERERLALWTMDALAGLMEDKDMSRAELAKKLGSSRAHVTQVFSGSRNPTLGTVADLAWALGYRAKVCFEPLRTGQFISVPVQPVSSAGWKRVKVIDSAQCPASDEEASSLYLNAAAR